MPQPLVNRPVFRVTTLPAASDAPGEFRSTAAGVFWSDGVDWHQLNGGGGGGVLYKKQEIFTASGTFTLPVTAQALVEYDVIGGGGAGGKYGGGAACGGGGGQRLRGSISLTPGVPVTCTVGAGGVGSSGNSTSTGADGGDTSFGSIVAKGGYGGASGTNTTMLVGATSGGGVQATQILAISTAGVAPIQSYEYDSAPSGSCIYFSSPLTRIALPGQSGKDGVCSGGGSAFTSSSSSGGAGAGEGNNASVQTARNATAPGCGGGGSAATSGVTTAGNGFRGEVRITYWDTVP